MLISTALVMLILLLFAQIYSAAVGSIREQEGIAKNDQKARSAVMMLRGDLKTRTFREIPVAISDRTSSALTRGLVPIHPRCLTVDETQQGFFSISENDPGDDSDDVLSFTVMLPSSSGQFTGRVLKDATGQVNHPDTDDGLPQNGVTSSRAAIITYFMNQGRLHRRVHLLRDPLVIPSPWSKNTGALFWLPTQPSDEPLSDLKQLGTGGILPLGTVANWRSQNCIAIQENPTSGTPRLMGVESLDNGQGLGNAPCAFPRNREGHDTSGNPVQEYSGTTFQGRAPLTGDREGEDIVLTNVIGFDIKVWEPQDADLNGQRDTGREGSKRGGRFVDFGHGELEGDGMTILGPFGFSAPSGNSTWGRQNTAYGPGGPPGNRIFDTWHPLAPAAPVPPGLNPPFYPLKIQPPATLPTPPSGWGANATATIDTTDWTQSSMVFPWGFYGDYSLGYRAVRLVNTMNPATTGTREPVWFRSVGNEVYDNNVIWECFDNRIGMTAMRITLRFVDPGSQMIRQVTVDHSFLD